MASIVFPSSPALNDVFTAGNRSWTWTGARWKMVKADWTRPAAWLPLPAVAEGVVGLWRVNNDEANFVCMRVSGAHTIDWGDGTVENYATNTLSYHTYTYSSIPTTGEAALGYRQVIVKITPQAGQHITQLVFNSKHNTVGLASGYPTGWLDLQLVTPNIGQLSIGGGSVWHRYLQQCKISLLGTVANLAQLFYGCVSLQSVSFVCAVNPTDTSGMFSGCLALRHVPFFNTINVTTFATMFNGCASLQEIPAFNTLHVTSMRQAFYGCQSLTSLPSLNTAVVNDMYGMFQNCTRLETFPPMSTPLVTGAVGMCQNCASLRAIPAFDLSAIILPANIVNTFGSLSALVSCAVTGINQTVSFKDCKLSATALNTIFTNLSATGTGKTITITGNYGAATCDTSIATAKGWTAVLI